MNAQRSTLNTQRSTPENRGARRGFTLLELLAVMAIVAMLATLAITSYFGAIRGMARRGANEHFFNALTQARQRACIDGVHVSLVAFNQPLTYDDNGNLMRMRTSYVICRELGRISFARGNLLFDEFADIKQIFGKEDEDVYSKNYKSGVRLYNLTQGCWSAVRSKVATTQEQLGSEQTLWATLNASLHAPDEYKNHTFEDYALELLPGNWARSSDYTAWNTGDVYGIEVAPITDLPKTFYFGELESDPKSGNVLKDVHYVTFAPDGSSVDKNGGRRPSVTFTIRSADKQVKERSYTVDDDGKFSVN